jgi:hypothetical protein
MIKSYIGTKIINAQPQDRDGEPGYQVIYPDGYASWSPKKTFEEAYREISDHERQLLTQTNAEAQVSAISDGDPEFLRQGVCRACGCTEADCRQCIEKTGVPCFWVDPERTKCSACFNPAGQPVANEETCDHAWHQDPDTMTAASCPRCGARGAVEDESCQHEWENYSLSRLQMRCRKCGKIELEENIL